MTNFYFNLTEKLQGCSKQKGMVVCTSNPDGEPTVKRQSRVMSQSGCSAVDVPMTSYGAPDEQPLSSHSAPFGIRWKPAFNMHITPSTPSRFARLAAMVAMMICLGVGEMWGM